MGRKPYRVEVFFTHNKKPRYYLVKSVKFKGLKGRAKRYLGVVPLDEKAKEFYSEKYAFDMEFRAAVKKAELSCRFYKSRYLTPNQMKNTETVKFIYGTFTELLTTNEIDVYEKSFEVNYVQGTTSIEGNTISVIQTYDLLFNNISPEGKSLREINEVQNFKKVKSFRDNYRGRVNVDFIKTIHSFIMNNIDDVSAGIFRRIDNVAISGCELPVTPSIMIEVELNKIISEYYRNLSEGWHPFEAAVLFHYQFEMIHPFMDGNGRVGREIFNYMVSRLGYPKLLFLGSDRINYIKSLKYGNENKYAEMIEIFADLIYKQRYDVLVENLKRVVVPPKRTGQLRIDDFFKVNQ